MHWIDWLIVIIPLIAVGWIGFMTQRYVQGVSDFLAAGRVAGRYVICVAGGEAALGLISVIALFEYYYKSGLALGFWSSISIPVGLIMTLTGFVIYRYRQTRVMTMAQFFEIRYSKAFRVFTGILAFVSGVVNYALFPAVGGRFLVYYCDLPDTTHLFGLAISTYGLVMAICIAVALVVVLVGGQLMTMVTDCVQGIFGYFGYAVIVIALLCLFNFDQIGHAILSRAPGESFINPFDTAKLTEFNLLYVIIGIFGHIYSRMSWQGAQGYNCAAKTPHEQKMGGVLATWRSGFTTLTIMLLVVAAFTYLNHPDFARGAAGVRSELAARINMDSPTVTETIRNQMLIPVALRHILPVGVTGIFAALMIFLMVSTDTTYLHSWGSIFIQDVVMPLRRKPIKPQTQIMLLRLSILGVAIFAWFFSYYFGQVTYILMFFAITGAIYLGGAGAVIIGGLYWKRGKASGAWAAMLTGASIGVAGFLCQKYWGTHLYPCWQQNAPELLASFKAGLEGLGNTLPFVNWKVSATNFPFSGQEMLLVTMVLSILAYVSFSLIGKREQFDLDRMLHRGKYDINHEHVDGEAESKKQAKKGWKAVLLGIDNEYTRGDRILAWSVFLWSMFNFAVFLVVVLWNLCIFRWSTPFWFSWWKYYTLPLSLLVGTVTTVWFSIGGTKDLMALFRDLKKLQRNDMDDGRVVGHLNADDAVTEGVVTAKEVADGTVSEAELASENMVEVEEEKPRRN